jgi:O-antigen/teichoic acid export membrane protein
VLRQLDSHAAGIAFFFINSAYFVVAPVSGGSAMAMVRPIAAAATDDARAQWLRAAATTVVPAVTLSLVVAVAICTTCNAPVLPMVLMVVGLSADTMYFQILTARHRYVAAAVYRLVANIAQLGALVLVLALDSHSVTLIVGIFALSYAFGLAAVELHGHTLLALMRRAVSSTHLQRRTLFMTALPTLITGLAYSGIIGLDTYLVRLANPDLVAGYGAAKTLAAPCLLVSLAVTSIIQPEAARATTNAATMLRKRLLVFGASGSTVAIAACWAFSGLAVHVVYGARYPEAVMTLRWLGTGTTLLGLHTLIQVWCWGRGHYIAPIISLGTGAVMTIVSNVMLVPHLGGRGAGVAICLGTAVAMVMIVGLSGRADRHELSLSDTPTTTLA